MANRFKIIQKIRVNRRFTPVLCAVLFSFSLCLGGCSTTHIENVNASQLPVKYDYKIMSALMKSGEKIALTNYSPAFIPVYKGIQNVIRYYTKDTASVINAKKAPLKENLIPLKDLKSVAIKVSQGSEVWTYVIFAVSLGGIIALLGAMPTGIGLTW